MAAYGINQKQKGELNSITEYFEPLMEFLLSLAEEEQVILVGHSFGRLCISVAMELFPTKIAAAVFDKTPRGLDPGIVTIETLSYLW
ncbi:hypothetical protein AAZX31_01G169600 [Glycine max]|uniref:Polyneuridine-aldehyde esterase isoform A n=1 Tax=Glycine soja TaxID=3848 RepID=A0A445M5C7_GLYSO|nr:polyneuridine-aldehyde esterase-like isoform X1 [Glycine soja]RZC30591.1 Polyneuridine-aldehyde esterase isoform A [Glycine soja]